MPIYTYILPVTANTSADTPATKTAKLHFFLKMKSAVHKLEVHFPTGCVGMVHLAIFYGIKQIYPEEEGMYFSGDGETISFDEYYELPNDPTELIIKGWSPGTSHNHNIIVRFGVLPKWYAAVGLMFADIVRVLKELVGI